MMGKNSISPRNFSAAPVQLSSISSGPCLSDPPYSGPLSEWGTLFLSLGFEPASPSTSLLESFMVPDSTFAFNFFLSACSISVQFLFEACIPARNKCWFYTSLKFLIFILHPNMAVGSGLYDSHIFVQGQPALHHLLSNPEFPLGPPIGFSFPVSNLLWANMLGPDLLNRNDWQLLCSMTDQISLLQFFNTTPFLKFPFLTHSSGGLKDLPEFWHQFTESNILRTYCIFHI